MRNLLAGLAILFGLATSPAMAQAISPPGTQLTKFFNATQAITRVFPAVSGKSIYLTQLTVAGATTAVFTLSTGTGTNCGTNTVVLYTVTFIAGEQVSIGDGSGVAAVIGPSVDLCVTIATAAAPGWLSIAQF
jgi:hypothetical protein